MFICVQFADVDNLLQSWLSTYQEATSSTPSHSSASTSTSVAKLPALDIFVLDCSECVIPAAWSASSTISTLFYGARRHGWIFVDSSKQQYQKEAPKHLLQPLHNSLVDIAKKHQVSHLMIVTMNSRSLPPTRIPVVPCFANNHKCDMSYVCILFLVLSNYSPSLLIH